MGEMTPIDGGALYRDVGGTNTHGDLLRVKRVWINGDSRPMINLTVENGDKNEELTVHGDVFIKTIGSGYIRVNTEHEAWEWRNEN